MPPKATDKPLTPKEELLKAFEGYEAIDVVERRFLNPNDPGSLPILLKGEPANACINSDHLRHVGVKNKSCPRCRKPARQWHVYWANTANEGRWSQIKGKGYIPVQVKELQDSQDVTSLVKQPEENGEMWVRRGDRGKEILMKIPLPIYNHIKAEAQSKRDAQFRSKKQMNADLAESAGRELGDMAGQMIHDGAITVESMRTSKSTLGDEARD